MSSRIYSTQADATSTQKDESNHPKRSILKSSVSQNIEIQADESQTQSQLIPTVIDDDLTSNSQVFGRSNRRVSFAPDVTLHSFDFVVSSTQNGQSKAIPANLIKHDLLKTQEENESDNGSMELTGPIHIVSAKTNKKEEPIQEQAEDMSIDTIQREERMSPIPLSIGMDDFEAKNDSTMELTGTFNQINDKNTRIMDFPKISLTADSNNVVNDAKEIKFPGAHPIARVNRDQPTHVTQEDNGMDFTEIKIGNPNIKTPTGHLSPSVNDIDATKKNDIDVDKSDEDMDMTQIKSFSIQKNENAGDEGTGMDFTDIPMKFLSNHDRTSNDKKAEITNKNDQEESGMDFTQIHKKIILDTNNEDDRMEVTQIHKIIPVHKNDNQEDEMDLTNIHSHRQVFENTNSNSNKENDAMEFTNIIAEQSNSKEKQDSKRVRVPYDSSELQSKNKIPRTRTTTISEAEKMSPIKLDEFNDHYINNDTENYSLDKFLNDIKSNFLQEIEDLKVSPKLLSISSKQQIESNSNNKLQLLTSLYSDIPWLQMVTFMSKELIMMNDKSQHVFDDLQKQIATSNSPPQLLKQYYNASDIEKESISEQLKVVKLYSYLEANKTWYKWQLSNMDNIKIILNENLTLLQEQKMRLEKKLTQQERLNSEVKALKQSIKQDILTFKNSVNVNLKEVSLDNKIKLAKLKRYMEVQKVNVKEFPILKRNREQLERDVSNLKRILMHLQGKDQDIDIKLLEKDKVLHSNIIDKLKVLENVTGIHFKGFSGDVLSFQVPVLSSDITFEINLNETCGDFITRTLDKIQETFTYLLFSDHFKNNYNPKTPVIEVMVVLLTGIRCLLPVLRQFKLLQRIFVCCIRKEIGGKNEYMIELQQQDFATGHSIKYQIPLLSFKSYMDGSNDNLVVYGSMFNDTREADSQNLETLLTAKTKHIIPCLNKNRVTVISGLLRST